MINHNKSNKFNRRFAIIIFAILLLGLTWPVVVSSQGTTLPPRTVPAAPSDDKDENNDPDWSYIELQATSSEVGLWSVVQWVDGSGTWHDVGGWRGTIADNGIRRWGVAPPEFGKGPFRWAIYQSDGGDLVWASDSFNLPNGGGQGVIVTTASTTTD